MGQRGERYSRCTVISISASENQEQKKSRAHLDGAAGWGGEQAIGREEGGLMEARRKWPRREKSLCGYRGVLWWAEPVGACGAGVYFVLFARRAPCCAVRLPGTGVGGHGFSHLHTSLL